MLFVPFFIFLSQHKNIENEQSFCPFKMLTGLPCPGCGITKSIVFFYDGDLIKSFSYHLFGPILLVFCFYYLMKLSAELYYKKVFFENWNTKKIAYIFAAILIVYHVIRLVLYFQNNTWNSILKASIWY